MSSGDRQIVKVETKGDPMEILRVFNNNVILARDGGQEVILTGRGLGFQAKAGQSVDESRISKEFIPVDGRDPDHMAMMLADIPPEIVSLVADAMTDCGITKGSAVNPILTVALADHVVGVLRRLKAGIHVTYPLVAEVTTLYPDEYIQAQAFLTYLNNHLDQALPQEESVAFALHLVNAGFSTGDLSYTYQMTGLIQQILKIVEETFSIDVDQSSVSIGRFITHLRYLFVRSYQHQQLKDSPQPITKAICESYPQEFQCALTIAALLELRLNGPITTDEVAYLTLHVARVHEQALREEAERRMENKQQNRQEGESPLT